jgi:hypothetical protein
MWAKIEKVRFQADLTHQDKARFYPLVCLILFKTVIMYLYF